MKDIAWIALMMVAIFFLGCGAGYWLRAEIGRRRYAKLPAWRQKPPVGRSDIRID